MDSLSFPKLPNAAIALNANSPVPAGGVGSYAWSTSLGEVIFWNGNNWVRPPGNAGASNGIENIKVSTFTALPTTYTAADSVLAACLDTGNTFRWNGYYWVVGGTNKGVNPAVAAQGQWSVQGLYTTANPLGTFSDVFEVAFSVPGARNTPGQGGYRIRDVYQGIDEDEMEMDEITDVRGYGTYVSDNVVSFLLKCDPGPFTGQLGAIIDFT